jgi:hypothetical protein
MQDDSNFDQYGLVVLVVVWLGLCFFWPPLAGITVGLVLGIWGMANLISWAIAKLRRARSTSF